MRNFEELTIWQKGHELTLRIYQITAAFPANELYGLTSQMRRSASSIPTNIAEGCGRNTDPEFKRFLVISSGSCSELHYQIILCKDLQFISLVEFTELSNHVIQLRKMINSLINKLK